MLSEGSSRFLPELTALVDGADALGPVCGPWRCINDFRYRKPRSAENMMSGVILYEARKPEFSCVVIFVIPMAFILIACALSRENWTFLVEKLRFRGVKNLDRPPPPGSPAPVTLLFQFRRNSGISLR
jgi:hypothetical protein